MKAGNTVAFRKEQQVRLLEAPDGYTSKDYPVTVGNVYEVKDLAGSCLVVTTDEPDSDAFIWRGRFESVTH